MNKRLLIAPYEKEGPLTLEEVRCPICWSVLMEPVTFACKHSVCLECFKKHIQEAALCCPCCRERISVWSRRAMKNNNLVNQPFWERLKKELPVFIQARLDGQDSQDVMATLDLDCNETANFNEDANCGTSTTLVVDNYKTFDGELTAAGEIRKEFESLQKQLLEDLENRRKREAQASAEFIRKLKEEEQGIRLLASMQQSPSTIVESEEKSVTSTSKSQIQPRQSRKLARNLVSEWSGTDVDKVDPTTLNETQLFEKSTYEEKTNNSFKGESSKTLTTTIVKSTNPLNKYHAKKVVQVAPLNSQQPSTSTSLSFALVQGEPYFVQEDEPRSTVKFTFNQINEKSCTPDSINIELNSHFRPIRTAPKTPPKRNEDGSYLVPRIVKSTPLRPRSISAEDESPQPGLRVDKLIRTADSEMNNGFVSSLPTVSIANNEFFTEEHRDIDDLQTQQVNVDPEDAAEDCNLPIIDSSPRNNSDEEDSTDKAEREYYLLQALQLEQFRIKKVQEDEDRRYAEMIHSTINKEVQPLARSRESVDRYSIRNWISSDTLSARAETHQTRNRKRTALALCTSVNDASPAAGNSLRRSTRISTARKPTENSAQSSSGGRKQRGRPRKTLS